MRNDRPLISIIIPCYNVSEYVEKAIQSILSQTYANLEIWIIDDASTDDTLKKINSFKDERIKVMSFKENTQKVGAVNEVLKKVNGDFIAFQDADDWSEPHRIELQLKEFQNDPDLGICFTGFRHFGMSNTIPHKLASTDEELKDSFFNFFKNGNGIKLPVCASMMISKSALFKFPGYHPYFKGRVAEDIHWIYQILKAFRGITVNKVLYNYSIRKGSMTQLQALGENAKFAYSWHLLSKIILKDIEDGIDVLQLDNFNLLKDLELEACEEALVENVRLLKSTQTAYENSMSFKIGQFILSPVRFFKSARK